jgi:hypothetical protein
MGSLPLSVALLCSALGTSPVKHVTVDQVDVIEYNHFYDDQGRHVFDQLIFYDWSPGDNRYQIRDWRLIKHVSQTPQHDLQRGNYVATWHDGAALRQVRAASMRETWTQYDPELVERSVLPKEQRRELSEVRKATRLPTIPVSIP